MSKKKSNTSKKSRKAQYRQSKKTDGVLKRPKEKKKFMDMTPESQEHTSNDTLADDSPARTNVTQDFWDALEVSDISGVKTQDQATGSPFHGFPSENGLAVVNSVVNEERRQHEPSGTNTL